MMQKTINAAIVGAGHRSLIYGDYALENPDRIRICAVAEPNPDRMRQAAGLFRLQEQDCYPNADALYASGIPVDLVINGTMDRYHVETTLPALRAGYNVLLEKPICATREELKLLVDAIQSSKFITQKKTNTLIKKLEKLVSKYDAQKLQRQVYVSGRIKAMNESIYYTVDAIHNAISENRKIKFQYYQWNVKKEMELRHDGAWYHISPWGLSWDDENYYLVGYDSEAELIKHYRVDKMLHIRMSTEAREGKEHFKQLDMADYAKKSFGMFGGKEKTVKLLVDNRLAGVIIDRFGKDIMLIPADENHFTVNVDVHVSKQFLGWVFSLGEQVKILSPEEVVEQMQGEVKRLVEQYDSRVKV